jgi:RNA polymerase sigma factor (sigma-70 family)
MGTMYCTALTDQELLHLYVNGDVNSLSILIHRHKKRIYTTIYMFVRDKYLAEDIFQETFIKIIDSLKVKSYRDEGKFLPWALRIAHNLCIDNYRKQKRKPTIVDGDGNDIFNTIGIYDINEEDRIITQQNISKIKKLIQLLPEEQKEVLILRHYADMSFKEIAKVTGISINTALGRMRYALLNLKKLIEEKKVEV